MGGSRQAGVPDQPPPLKNHKNLGFLSNTDPDPLKNHKATKPVFDVKDKDYCPIEIIKGLTDKGQFQYLTKLMGPPEGTYLYTTQFHSLR